MVSILNNYMHGYVLIPTLVACQRRDVFQKLFDPTKIADLDSLDKINIGNMKVAFRMFESLGWLERISETEYKENERLSLMGVVPDAVISFFSQSIEDLLQDEVLTFDALIEKTKLGYWLDGYSSLTDLPHQVQNYAQSPLLLPLIYIIKAKDFIEDYRINKDNLQPNNFALFSEFIKVTELGHEVEEALELNDLGRFLLDNVLKAGVTLSYHPMLQKMDDLLFGDVEHVFKQEGREIHIDRSLNVTGSGTQHNIFFKDLVQVVSEIVEQDNLLTDVKIVDMGCGDGSFLEAVYSNLTQNKTSSQNYELIGVDINRAALDEAAIKNALSRLILRLLQLHALILLPL